MNREEPAECILWGGYGFGNVGDELTLSIALRDMGARFGESLAVLSPVPGYTKALFPAARIIPYQPVLAQFRRRSLPARVFTRLRREITRPAPRSRFSVEGQLRSEHSVPWVAAVKQCDLLYLVGGGYFTDLFDLDLSLLPLELSRYCGKHVETAPLGIGPFSQPWRAKQVGEALRGVKVRVRDHDSKVICESLAVDAELCRDDGFRVGEVIKTTLSGRRNGRLIGINTFAQHGAPQGNESVAWWRDLLLSLKSRRLPLEGFCFHNAVAADHSHTVQLFESAGLCTKQVRFPDWDFRDACRRLSNYGAIVTSRFHAAVVASVVGVPTIAVASGNYYLSKMSAACQGQPNSRVVEFSETKPAEVVQILSEWYR